jgi:glucan-binding YG repeat protein
MWANHVSYTVNGVTQVKTYHFNKEGIMDSGWFLEAESGKWYYLSEVHDGWFGSLVVGKHFDRQDGKWYYLDPATGAMMTGWQQIYWKWYYFHAASLESAWAYDEAAGVWRYTLSGTEERAGRPSGSMYVNEMTPDGYRVDENGEWVEGS